MDSAFFLHYKSSVAVLATLVCFFFLASCYHFLGGEIKITLKANLCIIKATSYTEKKKNLTQVEN